MPCRASAGPVPVPCRASASPLVPLQPHHLACGYDKERSKSSIRLWDVAYEGGVRRRCACARARVRAAARVPLFVCGRTQRHTCPHARELSKLRLFLRCNPSLQRRQRRQSVGATCSGLGLGRGAPRRKAAGFRRPLLPRPRHATAWHGTGPVQLGTARHWPDPVVRYFPAPGTPRHGSAHAPMARGRRADAMRH